MTEGTSARTYCGLQGTEAVVSDGEEHSDVATSVVLAVAEARGVDPVAMDERLNDWIDPDALEALVESMNGGSVEFEMGDYRVGVGGDGRVVVTETDAGTVDL